MPDSDAVRALTQRNTLLDRWAQRRRLRVAGYNPWLLLIGFVRRFNAVRVPGLAAEISYYALVSLIPLIIALGASLGFLERLLGAAQVARIENALSAGIVTVFGTHFAQIMTPLVRGLLHQEFAGVALLSLLVTFFLASASFRAMIRALDDVYTVRERRKGAYVWTLAYLFAMASVAVAALLLVFVVIGPLLGGGTRLAELLGLGWAAEMMWALGRWPLVFLFASGYLAWLYRTGPNLHRRWRHALPGALFATVALVLIAAGLRTYLGVAGPQAPPVGDAPRAVEAAAETVGAVLALALWLWLSGIAILGGAVLNAELHRQAPEP